jgi:cytochrome c553
METRFIAILARAATTSVPMSPRLVSIALAGCFLLATRAFAQSFDARALAAGCASCHQPDQTSPPPLTGQSRDDLVAKLEAFRNGTREGTVMPQLARGYTPEQMEAIAAWYAAQKPPTR